MKPRMGSISFFLFLMYSVFFSSVSLYGMCGTTVLWHDLSDNGSNYSPGVVSDVIDQNIDIQGVNALVDGIHVNAQTCDILITITNNDSVITGSGDRADGVPTEPARLYLFADQGRTITFRMDYDLQFRGAANGAELLDLMVTVSGGGTVIFDIAPTTDLSFTSLTTSGGTRCFVGMDGTNKPTVIFRRSTVTIDPTNDVDVIIGPRSLWSYIATTATSSGGATQEGTIIFDPSNSGTGKMRLTLNNESALIIFGHLLTVDDGLNNPNFLLTDIDMSIPAGLNAIFRINNGAGTSVPSYLQVVNENTILGPYLINPFCEETFNGNLQNGFILGANATLDLAPSTYLDYIGTATNTVPVITTPVDNVQPDIQNMLACGKLCSIQDMIKERNASAFIVDGNDDPNAVEATINLSSQSAIYFRSGVSCDGEVVPTFTVNPGQLTEGAGNIIFDVEGPLRVNGGGENNTALSVLSLQVTPTGCPVTLEADPQNLIFPAPTFARNADDSYMVYNRAAWLINNRMDLYETSIVHTDYVHHVYERNNLGYPNINSEPTYIGGETFKLCNPVDQPRPTIALYDSTLRVHRNIGSTGVDWRIPNDPLSDGNSSIFRFYYNGRAIDEAYGRVMVLGTNYGAFSACGQLIDNNSHLDVFQDVIQTSSANEHELVLEVGANTTCITEGITGDIEGQYDVHSIFLNNASNISVGGNLPLQDLVTTPSLVIAGDFFAFETAGGLWAYPQASGTTGQGGMFIDNNGTVSVDGLWRASFGMMVTRIGTGIIDLPRNQVYFESMVGTTKWNIDLRNPDERVLVSAGTYLSDFTIDWGAITKDYVSTDSFVPYEPSITPLVCDSPAVTDANLRALPVIQGEVDQLQIKRSRIGDEVNLQFKEGAYVRELVFLPGYNAGEAPVGFLVIQDNAFVGLGTAHRNSDSLYASIKLGINGVTLCPNGNGTVHLNENVLIDNVCHIVTGTSFGLSGPERLIIHAQEAKEVRIKSTGILDLSQFDTADKILQFAGNVTLVCEPGAKIMLGGGAIVFTDNASWTFQEVLDATLRAGTQPRDLDDIRVKLFGSGTILMNENAHMDLYENQFFGIETDPQCAEITTFTWTLNDSASISIGSSGQTGGSFQIGNTRCIADNQVNAQFILDGPNVEFEIGKQGFLGLGVGMSDKLSPIPNEWLVNCLSNVSSVGFTLRQGLFKHNDIYSGDDSNASLLAIGPAQAYTWNFTIPAVRIFGGGNLVLLGNCTDDVCNETLDNRISSLTFEYSSSNMQEMIERAQEMISQATKMLEEARALQQGVRSRYMPQGTQKRIKRLRKQSALLRKRAETIVRNVVVPSINPTVQSTDGTISARLSASILAGKFLLIDPLKGAQPTNVTPSQFFTYLKSLSVENPLLVASPRANITEQVPSSGQMGFVDGTDIRRETIQVLVGPGSSNTYDMSYSSNQIGAIGINIDNASHAVITGVEIQGSL